MLQEQSVEYRAFKQHFDDLFKSIKSPVTLSARLKSAKVLTEALKSWKGRAFWRRLPDLIESQQVMELLVAVQNQVELDSQKFYKFLETLKRHDSNMRNLCDKLRDTYSEYTM